jgi:hypothetical protein
MKPRAKILQRRARNDSTFEQMILSGALSYLRQKASKLVQLADSTLDRCNVRP